MEQIGNYTILQKLGEGGMGEVFKGVDTMLEREVAIKVLRPELSQREDVLQRFRSEAVALGRLNHPNVATVYSFARDGDRYYMALEFVNGEGLDKLIDKRGRLTWLEAVQFACAALEGLEHAHRLNVIHRDVKPANILVAYTGAVKIMDFGIARILERAHQTRQGYLVGTLEYMSPEQIQGIEVDARSDIYSLGIVLYEMLTGRLPFQKDTEYDLLKSQIEESPPSPRIYAPDIPKVLEKIVLKTLAKKPNDRFNSAQECLFALHQITVDGPHEQSVIRETRLISPKVFTQLSMEKFWKTEANKLWLRFRELLSNYPIPALSILVLLLVLASFFFLSDPKVTENEKGITPQQTPSLNLNKPAPSVIPENEHVQFVPAQQLQSEESKKEMPNIPTAPINLPENPPTAILEQPPKSVPPSIDQKEAVRPVKQEKRKSDSVNRKLTSPKTPTKPYRMPAKQNLSRSKTDASLDEDADYWRRIERKYSSRKRSKPDANPRQQEDENADYWRSIDRKTSEFLKRQ